MAVAAAASFPQEIVEYCPFGGIERSSVPSRLFDVFINHRGPDVKDTLALQLYNSIKKMGFLPFLDSQEIELGDSIPSTLKNAIYSASVHIAIFSKGYAQSAWCLAELVLMLQSGVKIIPVFYDVTPSDLRYIENGVYTDAFARYKEKVRYLNKLDEWKKALYSVSLISGYECSNHNSGSDTHDDKLCEIISSAVLKEVQRKAPLDVAKHSVGLDEIVEDFEMQCLQQKQKQNIQIIGIFGMGGSGKTTLAKEFFNRKRSDYDGSSFLFDVREASVKNEFPGLQIKLLKDLFREDHHKFQSTAEGTSYLKYRLGRGFFLRFLIVLDDINQMDQLDALVMIDKLNPGSLVIVTTRDERVLMQAAITHRYKMKEMNQRHSRELFCWHAFCQPYASRGYEDLVESFMKECAGLPLSLKVLGRHVSGSTDKHYWLLTLDKVRSTLSGHIKQRLKISYDALDTEQKEIFMDIACFFIGKLKSTAIRIWEGSGWKAEHALQTLKDKCLVVEFEAEMIYWEDKWLMMNKPHLALGMHDHIRDLGRELAAERSRPVACGAPKISNLWCFHTVLESSVGGRTTYFLGNSNCCAETSTALLSLELYLREEQLISIPPWIPLQNLQRLRIVFGYLKRLWHDNAQAPLQLKELVLQQISLEEFPSLGMLNQLHDLVLKGKTRQDNPMLISGRSLSEALRKLTNLRSLILCQFRLSGELDLKDYIESTTFHSPLSNLQTIKICDVQLAYKVSVSGKHCPNLESLHLESMENLIEVDLRNGNTLNSLTVMSCGALKRISGGFDMAARLAILNLQECQRLERLPSLEGLSCLEKITIDRCEQLHCLIGIEELGRLKYLHLSRGLSKISVIGRHSALSLRACRELKTLSGSFDLADLSCLERIIINTCWNLPSIKGIDLKGLKSLHLSGIEVSVYNLLICSEHWPVLESIEVDLTIYSLTVRSCGRLKSIARSSDRATKLQLLIVEECPQLEVLTSLGWPGRIIINGCVNLPSIEVIEKSKGLKSLHLSGREVNVSSLLIHGDQWPSLESLEVDWTLDSLTVMSCGRLNSISGSFDITTELAIKDCPQLKQLPSVASLSCLESIIINGCLNLRNIEGIEKLEGLKYLHLSGGYEVIQICIPRIQVLPTNVTAVIGEAAPEYLLTFNSNLFTEVVDVKAVSGIYEYIQSISIKSNPNRPSIGEFQPMIQRASLKTRSTLNAIIVCAAVRSRSSLRGESILIPLPPDGMIETQVTWGRWIVTIVITGQEAINRAHQDISTWIPRVSSRTNLEGQNGRIGPHGPRANKTSPRVLNIGLGVDTRKSGFRGGKTSRKNKSGKQGRKTCRVAFKTRHKGICRRVVKTRRTKQIGFSGRKSMVKKHVGSPPKPDYKRHAARVGRPDEKESGFHSRVCTLKKHVGSPPKPDTKRHVARGRKPDAQRKSGFGGGTTWRNEYMSGGLQNPTAREFGFRDRENTPEEHGKEACRASFQARC
ncbi:hypothetical protein KI387_033129 [Taxus chinensis]|uniref:TIR domain-containing protein n=1 Tax=Taxus chinensis TaxID=29808 RepID=A0AA38C356_TAXCH|nr:hypothetical protein KI387_033129 [Taxus chinensis]